MSVTNKPMQMRKAFTLRLVASDDDVGWLFIYMTFFRMSATKNVPV